MKTLTHVIQNLAIYRHTVEGEAFNVQDKQGVVWGSINGKNAKNDLCCWIDLKRIMKRRGYEIGFPHLEPEQEALVRSTRARNSRPRPRSTVSGVGA